MKTIVAGSRSFSSYKIMKFILDGKKKGITEVVSGTARGADRMGEMWAKASGVPVKRFPADWSIGKAAGHIRNAQMAKYADGAIVFWDGESRGTKNMIECMKKLGKPVIVVNFDPEDKIQPKEYHGL